jgi:putative glutamine amidotransferase
MQVLTVARGGQLEQHMEQPHRHLRHEVVVDADSRLASIVGSTPAVSCYHHQCVKELGQGMKSVARSADGCIEAVEVTDAAGWVTAVQWHPEDTAADDASQQALFVGLVEAARASLHG